MKFGNLSREFLISVHFLLLLELYFLQNEHDPDLLMVQFPSAGKVLLIAIMFKITFYQIFLYLLFIKARL